MLLLSAEYAYLFDEKCHPISTLLGTILLLDLNICAGLHFPIIVANYAVHNFLGEQSLSLPIARANQSSMEWYAVHAKIICSQLELRVAPDG